MDRSCVGEPFRSIQVMKDETIVEAERLHFSHRKAKYISVAKLRMIHLLLELIGAGRA